MSDLTLPTKSIVRPRVILGHVFEFSLFAGIVAAMAVGVMRLQ